MKANDIIAEKWSQKYKRSINCSHPKGFSQRAHCAGKKKHNESVETEMTCPDCGMCQTHGNAMMEVKQRLDAKCWKGYKKQGTKIKGGVRVNNCVPESIEEGQFRSDSVEEFKPSDSALDDLKSKYLPDWEMLDHRTLQAKYVAADHRQAVEFVQWINKLSERMDHFAEVTQDVAEVAVKTSTFDVKGLTILDFQLAMRVDAYAKNKDIEQVRMQGNFGMHI